MWWTQPKLALIVLGDSDEAREALYRAISAWEGARLLWIGGLVTVGLASRIERDRNDAGDGGSPASHLASAAVLPVCVLALPEAFAILRLRRAILRAGVVERAAVLVRVFCLLYLTAITFGDQLSGYAGFMSATHFEFCFKRSTAKMEAAAS